MPLSHKRAVEQSRIGQFAFIISNIGSSKYVLTGTSDFLPRTNIYSPTYLSPFHVFLLICLRLRLRVKRYFGGPDRGSSNDNDVLFSPSSSRDKAFLKDQLHRNTPFLSYDEVSLAR